MVNITIPPYCRARVKQRLKMLKYVEDHGVWLAARHFALSRVTVRAWRSRVPRRWDPRLTPAVPETALCPRQAEIIPLVKQARLQERFGADRTRIRFFQVHRPGRTARASACFVCIVTLNHRTRLAFFRELPEALPFPIRKIQCDNGTDFPLEFSFDDAAVALEAWGYSH
jgi:hypothetical protein